MSIAYSAKEDEMRITDGVVVNLVLTLLLVVLLIYRWGNHDKK